jgi:hypothetical protein
VARLSNAASRHATGQDAAVCGPSRPGPLHNPLRKEHMQKHGTPSQANRGPKNPGRSLEGHGLKDLKVYANKFLTAADYSVLNLEVLYLGFRHKLAHLSFPYVVFDITNRKEYTGQKQRRITWSVHASRRKDPIELVDFASQQFLKRTLRPWPVHYNCRAIISVRTFQTDI